MASNGPGQFRCPCHNHLFSTRAELRHHMSACGLSTVGAPNYQTWLDNLDTTVPLPKLLPRTRVSRINEMTAATKARLDASQSARSPHDQLASSARQTARAVGAKTARRGRGTGAAQWAQAFSDMPAIRRYLTYLLSYGSLQQADEYQPQELTREVHAAIERLFECLDHHGQGRVDLDDFCRASLDALGTQYNEKNFGRVDKSRQNSLDFIAVMRLFFPQFGSKKLQQVHEKFLKPPDRVPTTREILAPADVIAIDKSFDAIAARRGGCTLRNLVGGMSQYAKDHQSDFEPLFNAHDADRDGVLTREEFMELVKSNYPPFRQDRRKAWGGGGDGDDDPAFDPADYDHWLSKDDRLYLPRMPDVKVRPYGQTELANAKRHGLKRQERLEFHERAQKLHLTNNAKRFAIT